MGQPKGASMERERQWNETIIDMIPSPGGMSIADPRGGAAARGGSGCQKGNGLMTGRSRITRWFLLILLPIWGGCWQGNIGALPCNGHGALDTKTGQACACEQGYSGGLCEGCANGFQDNNRDGSCQPSCASAQSQCTARMVCDDSSGKAECACQKGYEGPNCDKCKAGFQDNDSNGSCEVACGGGGMACGDNGVCNDSTGKAVCSCAAGFQDNDRNLTCRPSCASSQVSCKHGKCEDISGETTCKCETGFAGALCDACDQGFQDNDQNGTCLASCAKLGYSCSSHGRCDDALGTARCACDSGFIDDGKGNCTSNTFIVSHVQDNLSANDMTIMAQGLISMGFTKVAEDNNVTSAKMIEYLRNNVTLYFHTGHGFDGGVATADGSINSKSTQVNAIYSIFATCLTLTKVDWKTAFSSTTQAIMGYTQTSFDGTDDDQVRKYLEQLKAGKNHLQAWYLSNAAISSLSDRWAAYARDSSGSIVEYSARSGNAPRALLSTNWVSLGEQGNLRIDAALLAERRSHPQPFARARRLELLAEPTPWQGQGFGALSQTALTEEEAVKVAEAWLLQNGGLPEDALLDRVQSIENRTGPQEAPTLVGYEVRYRREFQGLGIRGNRIADHLSVLVGPESVVSSSRYWPELVQEPASASDRGLILSVGEALGRAADAILRMIKGSQIDLVAVEPVYGTGGPYSSSLELVPSYAFHSVDGATFVVDAGTGALVW